MFKRNVHLFENVDFSLFGIELKIVQTMLFLSEFLLFLHTAISHSIFSACFICRNCDSLEIRVGPRLTCPQLARSLQ